MWSSVFKQAKLRPSCRRLTLQFATVLVAWDRIACCKYRPQVSVGIPKYYPASKSLSCRGGYGRPTSLQPKRHLDRFRRFRAMHGRDQQTDRQTDRQATLLL